MGDSEAVERGGERRLGLLSVVAILRDAGDDTRALCQRLRTALHGIPYELVLVDDGSTDGTPEALDRLAGEDRRVRVIHLSRTFGAEHALTAGLDHAHGDALVILDADLRDPPETIHLLLDGWRAGADVVYGVREAAGEGSRSASAAGWLARPLERLAGVELEPDAGELRLLDRRAVDAVGGMRERSRFLRGMTVWVGLRQTAVTYEPLAPREAAPGTGFAGAVRHAFDATTAFSQAPLRAVTAAALALGSLALVLMPIALLVGILNGLGVTVAVVAILLLGGLQLVSVGILGAYVSRIYDESKHRPLYVVREARNLPAPRAAPASREPASTL